MNRLGLALLVCLLALAGLPAGPARPALADEVDDIYRVTKQDLAIARALQRLARVQQADGSWGAPTAGGSGPGGGGEMQRTAVTALVLMSFLANGHVPDRGPYGQVTAKAVRFLLGQARENGLIADQRARGAMYHHGTALLALTETYGMSREERLRPVLENGINLTLASQDVPKRPEYQGGWRYNVNDSDSDMSVTGWQLLSLRAAQNCGLPVPRQAIDRAVAYVVRSAVRRDDRRLFTYQPGSKPGTSRTAIAVTSLFACNRRDLDILQEGVDTLRRHFETDGVEWGAEGGRSRKSWGWFFYTIYYTSQAMFQAGGEYWTFWEPRLSRMLTDNQNEDGTWDLPPFSKNPRAGPAYNTAMCLLSLGVGERLLPIFQR